MKRSLVFAAVLVATTALLAQETSIAPATTYEQLGVSVASPNKKGWQLLKSDRLETVFAKRTEHEKAMASARTVTVDAGGAQERLASLESSKEKELNGLAGRRRDSLHFNFVKFKGLHCLQYDGIFPATETSGLAVRYFNFKGYRCLLPGTGNLVVELQFSSESNQRGFSEEVASLADAFFEKASLGSNVTP